MVDWLARRSTGKERNRTSAPRSRSLAHQRPVVGQGDDHAAAGRAQGGDALQHLQVRAVDVGRRVGDQHGTAGQSSSPPARRPPCACSPGVPPSHPGGLSHRLRSTAVGPAPSTDWERLTQKPKAGALVGRGYGEAMERTTWSGVGVSGFLDRAIRLLDRPGRTVLGIAGAPASGKSTLAALLLAELERRRPGAVVGVGMDAFHIGHRVLLRRGLTEIKGAPETFDAAGYIHLLRRIRSESGTIYAPEFDRDIEDSLAHVVEIGPEVGPGGHRGQLSAAGQSAMGPAYAGCWTRRGSSTWPTTSAGGGWWPGTCGTATTRKTPRHGPSATTSATPSWSTPAPNHPDLWIEQQPWRID